MLSQRYLEDLERFKAAHEQLRHEAELLWRICAVFALPHSIFLGFLLNASFGKGKIGFPALVVAVIFGVGFCLIWMMSSFRSLAIFDVRMQQAKKHEEALGWDLFQWRPEQLKEVYEHWTTETLDWWKRLRIRYCVFLVSIMFMFAYIAILVLRITKGVGMITIVTFIGAVASILAFLMALAAWRKARVVEKAVKKQGNDFRLLHEKAFKTHDEELRGIKDLMKK